MPAVVFYTTQIFHFISARKYTFRCLAHQICKYISNMLTSFFLGYFVYHYAIYAYVVYRILTIPNQNEVSYLVICRSKCTVYHCEIWWMIIQEGDSFNSLVARCTSATVCCDNEAFWWHRFKYFLLDTFTCPILGPLVPLFWISRTSPLGFKASNSFGWMLEDTYAKTTPHFQAIRLWWDRIRGCES